MNQWLIRTTDNWIAGPYTKEQIKEMILSGKLSPQDEICAANHYWISIHERDEIKLQLGIEPPPALSPDDEEITENNTFLSDDEPTDPQITAPSSLREGDSTENTKVIHTKALNPSPDLKNQRPQRPLATPIPQKVHIRGKKEGSSLWKSLAWLLVSLSLFVILAIFWFSLH